MVNIIYDERRMVSVDEIFAIYLKDIEPAYLTLDKSFEPDIINFYGRKNSKISNSDEITFIKYLGNGIFMDLVSDQLILAKLFNADDFGSDEFYAMDEKSRNEAIKMTNFWCSIQNPTNKIDFSKSLNIFFNNPLTIDVSLAPFITINSEVAKKFASQSLEEIKSMIMTTKIKAQQELKEQYTQYENQILNYLNIKKSEMLEYLNIEFSGKETITGTQSSYIDETSLHHPYK